MKQRTNNQTKFQRRDINCRLSKYKNKTMTPIKTPTKMQLLTPNGGSFAKWKDRLDTVRTSSPCGKTMMPPTKVSIFSPLPEYLVKNQAAWKWNWQHGLEDRMGKEDIKCAQTKLEMYDEEFEDCLADGDLLIPESLRTKPVNRVMKDEEERLIVESLSPSILLSPTPSVTAEWKIRSNYKVNLLNALRTNGQVSCCGCLTGVGCEWDGPMGEVLKARGRVLMKSHPEMTNGMIHFRLSRYYVSKRFGNVIEKMRKEKKEVRLPLPFCVEASIKHEFSGGKSEDAYVWFKQNRNKENTQKWSDSASKTRKGYCGYESGQTINRSLIIYSKIE